MMMNPNILNKNPLMFFDRAVNAQRSQLLTVMADAVSECRTAADQAAELNETGQVGLIRLAEIWSAIRAKEGMGGLILEGTEAKILSDVVAQFYAARDVRPSAGRFGTGTAPTGYRIPDLPFRDHGRLSGR